MKSWELLRELFADKGVKYFAGRLGRSRFLVHKWTEPAGRMASGARNPLDVLALLMAETDAARVAHWVCAEAGGRFVPAAQVPPLSPAERLPACHRLVGELGELVSVMGKLLPTGRLSPAETDALRRVFAQLQTDMARLLQPEKPSPATAVPLPDSTVAERPGGRRCRFRLTGHRCGFPHAAGNWTGTAD